MTSISRIETGLLLAAPSLGDPNFEGTVVLLGLHDDEDGSLGWTMNGPAVATAEEVVRATDLVGAADPLPAAFQRPARRGGPVSPGSVWIVYDRRGGVETLPGSLEVGEEIGVTAAPEALRALIDGKGPPTFQLLIGYAGWGAGQLAREIALGAWLPSTAKGQLIFEGETETLWRRAYADAIGTVPTAFVGTTRGSA